MGSAVRGVIQLVRPLLARPLPPQPWAQLRHALLAHRLRDLHSWHAAGSGGVLKARSKTVANRRYTVGAGDSCASLVVVQFQRQPPLVGELNRGWMCRSQSLFAGMSQCCSVTMCRSMPLCVPSWSRCCGSNVCHGMALCIPS
ncbi:unnamed protein product [Closterium sp. NIES-53]